MSEGRRGKRVNDSLEVDLLLNLSQPASLVFVGQFYRLDIYIVFSLNTCSAEKYH